MELCLRGCHPLNQMEIEEGCAQYDKDEPGCTPGIEEDAGKKGEVVLEFTRQDIIYQQESRKEVENKDATAEYHPG